MTTAAKFLHLRSGGAVIIEYRAMAEECFKWARGGEKGFPNA